MPYAIRPMCSVHGCPHRAVTRGRCADHALAYQRQYDRRRGSAASRGYDADWRDLRLAYLRAYPACSLCGEPATDVHHLTPKAQGGTDDRSNLAALCHKHHSSITARRDSPIARRR